MGREGHNRKDTNSITYGWGGERKVDWETAKEATRLFRAERAQGGKLKVLGGEGEGSRG